MINLKWRFVFKIKKKSKHFKTVKIPKRKFKRGAKCSTRACVAWQHYFSLLHCSLDLNLTTLISLSLTNLTEGEKHLHSTYSHTTTYRMSFRTMYKTYLLTPATLVAASLYVGAVLCCVYCIFRCVSFFLIRFSSFRTSTRLNQANGIRKNIFV